MPELPQSHLAQCHDGSALSLLRQHLPDKGRRALAHRGIQANAPGRSALGIRLWVIRRALSIYQRHCRWDIEKRHALLKSTLEVAPIWLKKNTRIEALMFLEFVAQMLAALVERALRQKMAERKIDLLCSLPEGRGSKTPTIEQVLRLFEHQNKHALYDGERLIKQFADPLTPVQSQILQLLSLSTAVYGSGN